MPFKCSNLWQFLSSSVFMMQFLDLWTAFILCKDFYLT